MMNKLFKIADKNFQFRGTRNTLMDKILYEHFYILLFYT